tara:strand:- start:163 stop:282 length:120 start_codon:yes stop_codon:yes gene_type:complete
MTFFVMATFNMVATFEKKWKKWKKWKKMKKRKKLITFLG